MSENLWLVIASGKYSLQCFSAFVFKYIKSGLVASYDLCPENEGHIFTAPEIQIGDEYLGHTAIELS